MHRTWRKSLLLFLQGTLIGTGAILPGISGGVLCVAFGIYEPMMSFLSHPLRSFRKDFRFLLPVLIGGATGFVLLAKVVEGLLMISAVAALSLFCGLICGTIPNLMQKSTSASSKQGWSWFILALIASVVFFHVLDSNMGGNIQANTGWYLFCGVIWGLSMIIPGLSSSSILLFMGLYHPMAQGIGNLDFHVILPLLLGFLITIALLAKIVNQLLQQHYGVLSKVILGFVISSVLMIAPVQFSNFLQLFVAFLCFIVGFWLSRCMDAHKEKTEKRSD